MRAGEVIDGRFEIERLAGSGGLGHVYRALDRQTGDAVALKVVQRADGEERNRLGREAQVLAALRPPGVVRVVAHGTTRAGRLYLATESRSARRS